MPSSITFTAIAALAALSGASPMIMPPPPCGVATEYTGHETSSSPVLGSTHQIVAMTCNGAGGHCTLGTTYSYSVSVAVTVGASLSPPLAEIASTASIGPSFSYSTTKGTADSASLTCPDGPWFCGIEVTPWVMVVSGEKQQVRSPSCSDAGTVLSSQPYSVEFPQVINHLPNVNAEICACPNGPAGSTTHPGAPKVCSSAC